MTCYKNKSLLYGIGGNMYSDQDVRECNICQSEYVHNGDYDISVCINCRDRLLNRPISRKVTIFIITIVCLSFLMMYRLPEALKAGTEFERGINHSNVAMHKKCT